MTYVIHVGEALVDQAPKALPGIRLAADEGNTDPSLNRVAVESGDKTRAWLGLTIFTGNGVLVELKYRVQTGTTGSLLAQGAVVGDSRNPTGSAGLLPSIAPAAIPLAYAATSDSFEAAAYGAITTALLELHQMLSASGICQPNAAVAE